MQTKHSKNKSDLNNLDIQYCPKCNKKLNFEYFHYGNLGKYKCPNDDFKRITPTYEAELIDDYNFKVDDAIIKMGNSALYNVDNLLACYTVAINSGIKK